MAEIGKTQRGPALYAGWPAWKARLLLAAILVLAAYAALIPAPPPVIGTSPNYEAGYSDQTLYRDIVRQMRSGADYYTSAANLHRLHHYPTTPAQVFREPALAWMLAGVRFEAVGYVALLALFCVNFIGLLISLAKSGLASRNLFLTLTAAMTGLAIIGIPDGIYFHEVWAALLIAASLLVYRQERWLVSLVLGLTACLFREIALPYLFAMGAFAVSGRQWGEAVSWMGAAIVFCLIFAVHLHFASALYHEGDVISAGWVAFGGLPPVLASARWNIALHALPAPMLAVAISLALVGLVGLRDPRADRAAFIVAGYMIGLLVVGRPENDYWGILYTPLLPLGFVGAPGALRDLWLSAFGHNSAIPKPL
jgi:hypothetical protein